MGKDLKPAAGKDLAEKAVSSVTTFNDANSGGVDENEDGGTIFQSYRPHAAVDARTRILQENADIAGQILDSVKTANAAFKRAGLEEVFRIKKNYNTEGKTDGNVFVRVSTDEQERDLNVNFRSKGLAVVFEHNWIEVSGLDVTWSDRRPECPVYINLDHHTKEGRLYGDKGHLFNQKLERDGDSLSLKEQVITLAVGHLRHGLQDKQEHRKIFDKLLGFESEEIDPVVTYHQSL